MIQRLNKLIYFFITLFFFSFADFYFSNLIVNKILHGWDWSNKFINFIYVQNTGAAFSILQHSTKALIFLSMISLVLIFYFLYKNIENFMPKDIFCASILLAGIFGNLAERIHFGYVRDFFDLAFIPFPIFNISDVFINVGVFAIILIVLFSKKPINFL